jgi:hypothetical protein
MFRKHPFIKGVSLCGPLKTFSKFSFRGLREAISPLKTFVEIAFKEQM